KMLFVGDDLTQLTRGDLGAMQGFATEEFVKLRQLVGDEARFLSFAELGFDSYSQLIYTTAPQLARHHETLRRFLAATRLGWTTALAEPETALATIRDAAASCTYLTPSSPVDPDAITLEIGGRRVRRDPSHQDGWDW
ncbi:MAG: ABC transporter substrate-binding protein, partial [Verrucomicrobiota bacterium]